MALLEICVDTLDGLNIAVANGADRIELCSALTLGGLSPSYALLAAAQRCNVPVHVMVRPRPGSFIYSPDELSFMVHEIEQIKQMGLAGVVIGGGSELGLDWVALKLLCNAGQGLDITVHRVIDLLPSNERMAAMEELNKMGVKRILTSGGAAKAIDALGDIKSLIAKSPEGFVVMPGSGVTTDNIEYIVSETNALEIHASASVSIGHVSEKAIKLGFDSSDRRTTSAEVIRSMKAKL